MNTLLKIQQDLKLTHPKPTFIENVYQPLLSPLIIQDTNLLQIGTSKNNTPLWQTFLPNATIHTLDDQPYSDETLFNLKPNHYHIISHNYSNKPEHLGFLIVNYHKFLKDNGTLIIEDIPKIEMTIPLITIANVSKYSKIQLNDHRNISKSNDDIILTLTK
jgi:hypothetical protein